MYKGLCKGYMHTDKHALTQHKNRHTHPDAHTQDTHIDIYFLVYLNNLSSVHLILDL